MAAYYGYLSYDSQDLAHQEQKNSNSKAPYNSSVWLL